MLDSIGVGFPSQSSVPIMSSSLNLFDDVGKSRRKNSTMTNEGQASAASQNNLMVGKESYKIRKTPTPPTPSSIPMKTKPVVIYVVPPTVIHAEASEFMDLVQRLTGPTSSSAPQDDAQQQLHESKTMLSPGHEEGTSEPPVKRRYQEEEDEAQDEDKSGGRRLILEDYMGSGVETHNDNSHQPSSTTTPYIQYFDVFRKKE